LGNCTQKSTMFGIWGTADIGEEKSSFQKTLFLFYWFWFVFKVYIMNQVTCSHL
jgi:hypothetical protein